LKENFHKFGGTRRYVTLYVIHTLLVYTCGGHVSGVVIPTHIGKQEKIIKQPKKNDNYVRNTGSQHKSKDAKKKTPKSSVLLQRLVASFI